MILVFATTCRPTRLRHTGCGYHLSRFVDLLNVINLAYVGVLTRLLQFEGNVCRERTLQLLQNHMYELDYAVLLLLLHSLRKTC